MQQKIQPQTPSQSIKTSKKISPKILGVIIVACMLLVATIVAALVLSSNGSSENSGITSDNVGISVIKAEKTDLLAGASSANAKYDIQIRFWNNGTSIITIKLSDIFVCDSNGDYNMVSYTTNKPWASAVVNPGSTGDFWVTTAPNGDASIVHVKYNPLSSVFIYDVIDVPITYLTNGNDGPGTSPVYGMSVLKVNNLSSEYTGLCIYELQVQIWNNDTDVLTIWVAGDLKAVTSDGSEYFVDSTNKGYPGTLIIAPGTSKTIWVAASPGTMRQVTSMSATDDDGGKFGCNVSPRLYDWATNPRNLSVISVEYVTYADENPGQHFCSLVLHIQNDDEATLHLNMLNFVAYGTDGIRYDNPEHIPGDFWLPFDLAPGRSTSITISFETADNVKIEHITYEVTASIMDSDVPIA